MVRILFTDTKQEKAFLNLPFEEQVKKSVTFEGFQNCSNDEWDEKSDCTIDYVRDVKALTKKEAKEFLTKDLDLRGFPIKLTKEYQQRTKNPTDELDFVDALDVLEPNEEVCYKQTVNEEGYGFSYDDDDICIKKDDYPRITHKPYTTSTGQIGTQCIEDDIFNINLDTHIYINAKDEFGNEDYYQENKDPKANHYVQEIWSDITDYEQKFNRNKKAIFKQNKHWFHDNIMKIPETIRGKKVTTVSREKIDGIRESEENTYIAFLNSNHLEFIGVHKLNDDNLIEN